MVIMEQNNYLRLALMLSDNNTSTFNQNLEMMIKLALHDEGLGNSLDVIEIIDRLKTRYGLSFTDGEVLSVLERKHTKILCLGKEKSNDEKKYALSPIEFEKLNRRLDTSKIDHVAQNFIKGFPNLSISAEEFKILWMRYVYALFNSNADTIQQLLSGGKNNSLITPEDFSIEEKSIINTFIFWEDSEKDKCMYQMVSCGFDYCMMTLKQNKETYATIFKNKTFILDTNIIFRLMGLNQEGRKKLIRDFIDKCKAIGIKVSYTNITLQEIFETIDYHVENIKNLVKSQEPIDTKAVYCMDPFAVNEGFYQAYFEWCKKTYNKTGDFSAFALYLKREAHKVIDEFQLIPTEDYSQRDMNAYNENVESLTQFKANRYRKFSEKTIKVDVINFMKVWELNKNGNLGDFFNTNFYIISADHAFSDWVKEKYTGTIPMIVLPSVWYSIILKYYGRTDDDAASFTRFLYFSMGNNEEADARKRHILEYVIDELPDSADIKSRTLYEINAQLQRGEIDLDSPVEEIVNEAHEYVTEQEVEKARAEEAKKFEIKSEEQKSEYNRSLKSEHLKHEAELNESKAENARLQREKEEALLQAEKDKTAALEDQISNLAKKDIQAIYNIYVAIAIILAIGLIANFIFFIGYVRNIPQNKISSNVWQVLSIGIPIIFSIVSGLIIKIALCGLSKDEIQKRIENHYKAKLK